MKWWEREAREETSYRELVYEAWADWQAAMNYFETVKDPELVDFAIYDLEAARRKYMYMLGQVRKDEAGAGQRGGRCGKSAGIILSLHHKLD